LNTPSRISGTEGAPAEIDAALVTAFLRDHPAWLAEHPDLYRVLTPPERVHGEGLADHMAAMLRAAREDAAEMAARADGVLAAGRAAAGLAQLVQEAVLALIRSGDPAECVNHELAGILRIDQASLCAEGHAPIPGLPNARELPAGTVDRLLEGRSVVFRTQPPNTKTLHGEAAALANFDALVHIPGAGAPALLALAKRDPRALDPSQGSGALAFLGRAIATALGR
jgi:uncharacterized protein YigA (DUF484 family)